jgi:hypothetical protein
VSEIWVPPSAILKEQNPDGPSEVKCPAARMGTYGDSGNTYIRCGVEGKHFPVRRNLVAASMWCCGDYGECPVWQAAKNHDPVVEKVQKLGATDEGQ